MPGLTLTLPSQVLPDTPPPKKYSTLTDVIPTRCIAPSSSRCELQFAFSSTANSTSESESDSDSSSGDHCTTASISDATDTSREESSEAEEHTLSAYGDLSLSEDIIVPSADFASSPIQPKRASRTRLRLKVRRPPMPKRRLSYVHVGGPMAVDGETHSFDGDWPGSPSPVGDSSPWHQHQPLVLPPTASGSESSIGKLVEGLMPHSPSIRLCPSQGSPAKGPVGLPQEVAKHTAGGSKSVNAQHAAHKAAAPTQSPTSTPTSPLPAEQIKATVPQDKPHSGGGGWRTRLPPRLPIPKWDV
ncbi:hypothetical protein HYDPIDRAFT_166992 [Hydnomerulius pinastri MD-312]|nr:hypothetical protein HYDPIDRAFT_166992 [Hydnomerulius pinastri MD-312]